MGLIDSIIKHKATINNKTSENCVTLNGECISLVIEETENDIKVEKVVKECNVEDLKAEYIELGKLRKEIEDLFTLWGVEL
jgi:hypothetical protein